MYSKLFASILDSSVWLEPLPTRVIWLTLLAAKDKDGFARFAAIENLARRAIVSTEDAERAVAKLEAPDPRSSNPAHEGRRIERFPGGWLVLNAGYYDAMVQKEDERRATRERMQRLRSKKRAAVAPIASSLPDLSDRFENTDHREAYQSARAAATLPAKFDTVLRTVQQPTTGGTAYDWPIIGQAILEIQNSGGTMNPNSVRGFCRRIKEQSSLGPKGGATGDGIDWNNVKDPGPVFGGAT